MARLLSFEESRFPALAASNVEHAFNGILHYLYNGRNAWHATWVMQYTNGCMHSDFWSACNTAERQRTQGSVFYITQIPAIIFKSPCGVLAATEINTAVPLFGCSQVGSSDELGDQLRVVKTTRIEEIASSFREGGKGIIVVATEDMTARISDASTLDTSILRSYSEGGSSLLGWSKMGGREAYRFEHYSNIIHRLIA